MLMSFVKTYIKSRTTGALRTSVRQVRWEWQLSSRHWSSVKKVPGFLQALPVKLNLGCGPNVRKGWLNIDLLDSRADLQLDLRECWPFPDGGVSHIYSEHVFEHFEFQEEVPHFLSEALRVLSAEGIFDVGVPDTAWPLRAHGNPNDDYWSLVKPPMHPNWCETQLDHINYHFRQERQYGEHKYAWDEETLARSLQRAGFTSIVRRQFDPALDSESRRAGTLYMRAIKC